LRRSTSTRTPTPSRRTRPRPGTEFNGTPKFVINVAVSATGR
jgi:hypothetical protein